MQSTQTILHRHLLLLVFLLSMVYYAADNTPFFGDSDPAWHIMAGKQILELGHLPESDSWSYDAGQTKWYNLSWAFDITLSKAYDILGLEGLKIFWLLLGSLLMTLLAYSCLMAGASWFVIIPTICMALVISFESMSIRPQMVTFYMCLVFYITLFRFREENSNKSIYLLPPLMALWINCHGGFIAGYTILSAFFAESFYKKEKKNALQLALVGILCGGVIFLNPYGIDVFEGIKRTLGADSSKHITEWRGAVIPGDIGITLYFLAFILCARFASPNIHIAEKLLAVFWLVAGISSIRNFHIANLLATPFLALSLSESLAGVRKTSERDRFQEFLQNKKATALLIAAITIVMVSLTVTPLRTGIWGIEKGFPESIDTAKELEFIQQHYGNLKFLNDYDIGGSLIFTSGGKYKVFIDSRNETAYSAKLVEDYFKIYKATAYADELLGEYKIDGIIIKKKTPLAKYLQENKNWRKVLDTAKKEVFVRSSKATTPAVP